MISEQERWITLKRAAELSGLSESSLRVYAANGRLLTTYIPFDDLPAYILYSMNPRGRALARTRGGLVLTTESAVQAYLASKRVGGRPRKTE